MILYITFTTVVSISSCTYYHTIQCPITLLTLCYIVFNFLLYYCISISLLLYYYLIFLIVYDPQSLCTVIPTLFVVFFLLYSLHIPYIFYLILVLQHYVKDASSTSKIRLLPLYYFFPSIIVLIRTITVLWPFSNILIYRFLW